MDVVQLQISFGPQRLIGLNAIHKLLFKRKVHQMPAIPLPEKSVPYSTEGFSRIYQHFLRDPTIGKLIAEEIELHPKRVIDYVFDTSEKQKRAIEHKSDDELRKLAQPLLAELRSKTPGAIEFHPSVDKDGARSPKVHVGECFDKR